MEAKSSTSTQDKNLTCGICFDQVTLSKELPCYHTFCHSCLEQHIKHSSIVDEETSIACPQCRRAARVPQDGVDGFPSSYYELAHLASSHVESGDLMCGECGKENSSVAFCIECFKNLCGDCKKKHLSDAKSRSHHILVMGDGKKQVETRSMCVKHPTQELKFYCMGCKEPICGDCRQTIHYDKDKHPAVDISEVAAKHSKQLSEHIIRLRNILPTFAKAKENADHVRDGLKNHANETIERINERRQEVHRIIDQLCDDDVKFVQEREQVELKMLEPAYDAIKEDFDYLCRSIESTEPVLQMGEDVKIITAKKQMDKVVEQYQSFKPKALDEKRFIFTRGIFSTKNVNDYIGLLGFERQKLSFDFSFETNHLLDYSIIPESMTEAWLSYFTSEESALVLYDETGNVKQDISLTPMGRSRVAKLGSDFLISCRSENKLMVFRGNAHPFEEFAKTAFPPRGIAVSKNNRIIVCTSESEDEDDVENALLVYSERGELLREVKEEDEVKIFRSPRYVAINVNGDICVSDQGRHCVVILNENFEVKARYTVPGDLKLNNDFCPRGICCDRFGRIIVTDGCNNKIHLLSTNGEFLRFLLTEEDGLHWPYLVAVGPGDKLWVVCRGCIRVYSYLCNEAC